jgi:hypothetical protein
MSSVLEQRALVQFCNHCGAPLNGRRGKRFCKPACRSQYNNILNQTANNTIRNTNNVLARNRRILERELVDGQSSVKISKDNLLFKGFNFKYLTHKGQAKTGKIYTYCYEFGYMALEDDLFLIVREKETE